MALEQLISFLGSAFLLTIMPGPDNLYVLSESLLSGKKQGVLLSAGFASGVLVHTLLAATGIGFLLKQSPLAFNLFKWIGFAYLLFLAWQAYHTKPDFTMPHKSIEPRQSGTFLKAFFMNILNPKVTLFFLIFLPSFVTSSEWTPFYQILVLGFLFMLQAFLVFLAIAFLADRLRPILIKKSFNNNISKVKVSILLILAFFIIL